MFNYFFNKNKELDFIKKLVLKKQQLNNIFNNIYIKVRKTFCKAIVSRELDNYFYKQEF